MEDSKAYIANIKDKDEVSFRSNTLLKDVPYTKARFELYFIPS